VDSRMWPCPECGEVRVFAQPPCLDGHAEAGVECPEWACTDCGAAIVMGGVAVVADVLRLRHAA
jgi:hypothetical protein